MAKQFGGQWTVEKLDVVEEYLRAYLRVFKNRNKLRIGYIDAFAGDGSIEIGKGEGEYEIVRGSSERALSIDPGFDAYRFVELDPMCAERLRASLSTEYPSKDLLVIEGDANKVLMELCARDWRTRRAVIFLDPTGAQVEFETMKALAGTRSVDVWIWFPIGVAINRLLPLKKRVTPGNEQCLDKVFGTHDWTGFYSKNTNLFDEPEYRRIATTKQIASFYIERLKTIFPHVSESGKVLRNSKNSPLYMLCFAAANPGKGGKMAVSIATSCLNKL